MKEELSVIELMISSLSKIKESKSIGAKKKAAGSNRQLSELMELRELKYLIVITQTSSHIIQELFPELIREPV